MFEITVAILRSPLENKLDFYGCRVLQERTRGGGRAAVGPRGPEFKDSCCKWGSILSTGLCVAALLTG